MKKLLAMVIALAFVGSGVAVAHQPVVLLNSDTTAAKGPLLVDGTVSFAVRAAFNKSGEKKAFRAQFQEGDALEVQFLIIDKKPENALKMSQLPTLVVTGPGGFKTTMKLTGRSCSWGICGSNCQCNTNSNTDSEANTYRCWIHNDPGSCEQHIT